MKIILICRNGNNTEAKRSYRRLPMNEHRTDGCHYSHSLMSTDGCTQRMSPYVCHKHLSRTVHTVRVCPNDAHADIPELMLNTLQKPTHRFREAESTQTRFYFDRVVVMSFADIISHQQSRFYYYNHNK